MADCTLILKEHYSYLHEDGMENWQVYEYECGCKHIWVTSVNPEPAELVDSYHCKFHWYLEF